MNTFPPPVSRHRLLPRYRISLVIGWVTPVALLLLTVILSRGLSFHVIDPRFWLPLLIMLLPALYVWREGVDVLPEGLFIRFHWPRYRAFADLDSWHLDSPPEGRLLTIWDQDHHKALEVHTAHLTDCQVFIATLRDYLRYRN